MEHYQEVMFAFSQCIADKKLLWNAIRKAWSLFQNPSWKMAWSAPWRRNRHDVISGWQQNLVISKTMRNTWKVTMDYYQEVMVALPESILKNHLKRPLAEKLRWRPIRLAIKPRYLGNHASQIKSYYGTLSGSHSRSFRICHEKSPEAPPGGEITMTSYPPCNKTSLSPKPCIAHKMLLWITITKIWSLSNFY